METVLRIQGMVCGRCIEAVRQTLTEIGLTVVDVQLGTATVSQPIEPDMMEDVKKRLDNLGFSLLVDAKTDLVERIKSIIQQIFERHDLGDHKIRFSALLEKEVGLDYDTLSHLFSSTEGITIEKYLITKRLDKVKELLVYTDLTLYEIAYQTGFSSAQHLSNQFKQLTGLTTSYFKTIKADREKVRDRVAEKTD